VPWVSTEAAEANRGKSIDEQSAAAAGTAAVSKARPLSQNAYKVKLTSVAVKRALLLAAGQTNATRFRRRKGWTPRVGKPSINNTRIYTAMNGRSCARVSERRFRFR
jgi:hypothetical protein